jgi:hypothetical protein
MTILAMFAATVFITGGVSFYAWFSRRITDRDWESDFAGFRKETVLMIDEKTRRPPKEWVLEDFERLVDQNPDKFHVRFIMLDGTKVEIDRKGFARGGEDRKRDPYLE